MSHSLRLPQGWALQTHMLHTQPCGARQPLRPPSRRCQSLAADQLPRGEVGGSIQLTRQKVAMHPGGRGPLYLPFKAPIPSRASLESQNSPPDRPHLPGRDHPDPAQRAVCPPPHPHPRSRTRSPRTFTESGVSKEYGFSLELGGHRFWKPGTFRSETESSLGIQPRPWTCT